MFSKQQKNRIDQAIKELGITTISTGLLQNSNLYRLHMTNRDDTAVGQVIHDLILLAKEVRNVLEVEVNGVTIDCDPDSYVGDLLKIYQLKKDNKELKQIAWNTINTFEKCLREM